MSHAVSLFMVLFVMLVIQSPSHLIFFYFVPKMGHAVAHLVEALPYNTESRGFDSRWCHWNPSGRTMSLGLTRPLTEMSNRNLI
jgi:hypothetical protein